MDKQLIIDTLINWFPMLLLIAVWIFFLVRMRGGYGSKYQKDCMEMWRRQVEALERIAATLDKKTP
jgi:ATP-dependent Zn protease